MVPDVQTLTPGVLIDVASTAACNIRPSYSRFCGAYYNPGEKRAGLSYA